MRPLELTTRRARLRPVEAGDFAALHGLFTDPDVRRYLWDDEVVAPEVTRGVITRSQAQFAAEGHGLWVARPHDSDEIIAFCGFWYFHQPPQLEILYGVAPSRWGQGLAVELAGALLHLGFRDLGFERIVGSTDGPNRASARVMEKLGMNFERREIRDDKETVWFAISEKDFS